MTTFNTMKQRQQHHDYSVAVELNNIGVYLLEGKSYRRAMKTFKVAIEAMKKCVQEQEAEPETTTNGNNNGCYYDIQELHVARKRLSSIKNIENIISSAQIYTPHYGFQRQHHTKNHQSEPILIDARCCGGDAQQKSTSSAILFYNFALAHICLFGKCCSNDRSFLDGASELLQMSYDILVSMSSGLSTLVMDMTINDIRHYLSESQIILAMQVLTNLVQIKQVLGQHHGAQDTLFCLQRLGHAVDVRHQDDGARGEFIVDIQTTAGAA